MRLLFLLWAGIFQVSTTTNSLLAQRLSLKQQLLIEKTMEPILKAESGKHEFHHGKGAFVVLGKDTLFNAHGLRYLFKITGDTVIRLDKSIFHGSNFWRYLFEYNDQIFLMGGYGQFVTNNNLESFNFDSKEWYLIKTDGDKPNYIKGCVIRQKDQLYLFCNTHSGNNIEEDICDPHFYRLDLPTLHWKKYPIVQPELLNFQCEIVLYTNNYILVLDHRNTLLIETKSLNFIIVPQEEMGIKTSYQNISVDGDMLYFSNDVHHPSFENLPGINLSNFWNSHKSKAKKLNINPNYLERNPKELLIAYFIGVILLVVGLFIVLNNRIKNKKQTPLLQKFQKHASKTLTTEELDLLLGIEHMEMESKKAKRHRILAQIEVASPGLIQRIKDESDKRRFVYFISPD